MSSGSGSVLTRTPASGVNELDSIKLQSASCTACALGSVADALAGGFATAGATELAPLQPGLPVHSPQATEEATLQSRGGADGDRTGEACSREAPCSARPPKYSGKGDGLFTLARDITSPVMYGCAALTTKFLKRFVAKLFRKSR